LRESDPPEVALRKKGAIQDTIAVCFQNRALWGNL